MNISYEITNGYREIGSKYNRFLYKEKLDKSISLEGEYKIMFNKMRTKIGFQSSNNFLKIIEYTGSFRETFKLYIKKYTNIDPDILLGVIIQENLYMSGGLLTKIILTHFYGDNYPMENSDIDLFCEYDKDDSNIIMTRIEKVLNLEFDEEWDRYDEMSTYRVFETKSKTNIQIIFIHVKPEEWIGSFDLSIVRNMFNGIDLFMYHPESFMYMTMILYENSKGCVIKNIEKRIQKYSKLGFELILYLKSESCSSSAKY